LAARRLRGGIDGALQLGYQLRNGALQLVSEVANRSPIMRLLRTNPNGLIEHGGRNVVGMGYKWERHPLPDGLIGCVDLTHPPTGPGAEDDGARHRQQEGEPNGQCAPPRFPHNSI
jgi:hypothetical protein